VRLTNQYRNCNENPYSGFIPESAEDFEFVQAATLPNRSHSSLKPYSGIKKLSYCPFLCINFFMNMTIGQYLLDSLLAYGVEHLFGIPGDYNLKFVKQIENHKIAFINATRENTAGYMADAYGRQKGLGACLITYGVGINIVNAASQAFAESSPLVIISGAPAKDEFKKGNHLHHLINPRDGHEHTQENVLKNVTIDQAILTDAKSAKIEIDRVLLSAFANKKPVYIELPRDLVEKEIEIFSLDTIEKLLKKAKRPVIWIGHEIERHFLGDAILQFAEKCHIPFVTALLAKGVLSEKHPLFAGVYQGALSRAETADFVESSDLVLSFGVLLSDVDTGIFTAKLPANFHEVPISFAKEFALKEWGIRFERTLPQKKAANLGKKLTMQGVLDCLESHLDKDTILVADIGDSLFGAAHMTVEKGGFMACSYFANMGFSIPGSIALKIAEKDKRIVVLIGDGAFQMTCNELSTAVRYGLPIIVIVLNNRGYGTERVMIDGKFNDVHNWNYTLFPELLGSGIGIKVTHADELEGALKSAFREREKLHLIEILLDKNDFSDSLKRLSNVVIF